MSGLSIATKGKIIGCSVSSDWTTAEKSQIRDALGVDGTKTASAGGLLQRIKSLIDLIFVNTA